MRITSIVAAAPGWHVHLKPPNDEAQLASAEEILPVACWALYEDRGSYISESLRPSPRVLPVCWLDDKLAPIDCAAIAEITGPEGTWLAAGSQ